MGNLFNHFPEDGAEVSREDLDKMSGGLTSLFDELYFWVFKMEREPDTDNWRSRKGWTNDECMKRMDSLPKSGTNDEMRAMIEREKEIEIGQAS